MIYFVRCQSTGRVKIGFSDQPWLRFVKIQADCPTELAVAAIIEGDLNVEADLHAAYAKYNVRGEWFAEVGDLRDFIASLTPAEREGRQAAPPPLQLPEETLVAEVESAAISAGVAMRDVLARAGVAPSTYWRWRKEGRWPSTSTLARLRAAVADLAGAA